MDSTKGLFKGLESRSHRRLIAGKGLEEDPRELVVDEDGGVE